MPVRDYKIFNKKTAGQPDSKPLSSLAQRDRNRMLALELANDFGFGNITLLAKFCFRDHANPTHQAARFQKKLAADGFIKVINLDGNGSVYVLTRLGINLLETNGVSVIGKGKEFGRFELCPNEKKRFVPPVNFYHNLLAATALACLAEKGWTVISEREIRHTLPVGENVDRYDPKIKIPDGLAISPSEQNYLVEVENSRKTSHDLTRLIDAIVAPNDFFNAHYYVERLLGFDPRYKKLDEVVGTIVVYDPKSISSDGRRLNHLKLIEDKVDEKLKKSETVSKLAFCECKVLARNVVDIQLHQEKLLIGKVVEYCHQYGEPASNAPLLGKTEHSVKVWKSFKPTVRIDGYMAASGATVYDYLIDGMLVCELDKEVAGLPRGRYSTRKEAYWFSVFAMYRGLDFDMKNRPDAADDYR